MRYARMLTGALCLLTAAACSMTPAPQASLTAECPVLESVEARDMGDLLGVCIDTAEMYNRCAARHKALAESLKPTFDIMGWFR